MNIRSVSNSSVWWTLVPGWWLCLSAFFGVHLRAANGSMAPDNALLQREDAPPKSEMDARADFVLVFSKYAEWPDQGAPGGNSNFVIGILGESPIIQAFEKRSGSQINGRKVVLKQFRKIAELETCHVLYVPNTEEWILFTNRNGLATEGVLMVGESNRFFSRGGTLQVFVEDGRIQFNVNRIALHRASIRVEAKVLSLAKRIIAEP